MSNDKDLELSNFTVEAYNKINKYIYFILVEFKDSSDKERFENKASKFIENHKKYLKEYKDDFDKLAIGLGNHSYLVNLYNQCLEYFDNATEDGLI
jgi:hypothetical protein